MASVAPPVHELIDRVKNVFIEVPGTQLREAITSDGT
jgi:hypothetical protein